MKTFKIKIHTVIAFTFILLTQTSCITSDMFKKQTYTNMLPTRKSKQDSTSRANHEERVSGITKYSDAIKLDPNNGDLYYKRGLAKANASDSKGAMKDYKKAIKKGSKYSDTAYFIMAHYEVYMLEHNYPGYGVLNHNHAAKNFAKAIKFNPKYVQAYYEGGLAKMHDAKFRDAIEYFTKTIELSSMLAPYAYYWRGNCKTDREGMQLRGIDPEGGCADYKKAASLGCTLPIPKSCK